MLQNILQMFWMFIWYEDNAWPNVTSKSNQSMHYWQPSLISLKINWSLFASQIIPKTFEGSIHTQYWDKKILK